LVRLPSHYPNRYAACDIDAFTMRSLPDFADYASIVLAHGDCIAACRGADKLISNGDYDGGGIVVRNDCLADIVSNRADKQGVHRAMPRRVA
jgi:hypothetical protein